MAHAQACPAGALALFSGICRCPACGGADDRNMLEFTDRGVVVVGDFSKAWAMTGWRLGWLVAPEPLADTLQSLMQNFSLFTNAVDQTACIVVLEDCGDDVRLTRAIYDERRRYLLKPLPRFGFSIPVE